MKKPLIFLQTGKVNTGALYIIVLLLLMVGMAYVASGPTPTQHSIESGVEVAISSAPPNTSKQNLQLYTFNAVTITPPMGSVCKKGGINTNPERILAFSPAHGTSVRSDGQIKVWLNGPAPFKVAPNEQIVRGSGAVKTPGDRSATAPDGYIWEPALYLFPNTIERGGRAFFPALIQGSYDNGDIRVAYGSTPLPSNIIYTDYGRSLQLTWNVRDLGIGPGQYQIQVVAHDGTGGRAIACITIRVYEAPDPRTAIPQL